MKKTFLMLSCVLIIASSLLAQPPKLVVVISLDQFPYDYIERFQTYFGKDGFNLFLKRGANFTNARYEYATTKTAAGHAVILTGCYGHDNGIVGNRWWDRQSSKIINSVDDDSAKTLVTGGPGHSPKNLETFTAGDMLRIASRFQSKVISLSHKDRSAVLLGGKLGIAYWFNDSIVVTSSFYMKQLPSWITRFNASGKIEQYFGKEWNELQPVIASRICDLDDAPYEQNVANLGKSFPHRIIGGNPSVLSPSYYRTLECSPFATEILLDLAREACRAESLGMRAATDMLCLSISATDEIGHPYGPFSHEVFDNVVRTDASLAGFFSFLDKTIGLENCLLVLTSDHGIAPIPEYLRRYSPGVPSGRISPNQISMMASTIFDSAYGKPDSSHRWIAAVVESDIYLDRSTLALKKITPENAVQLLKQSLAFTTPFIGAFTRAELSQQHVDDRLGKLYARSFFPPRSGDIVLVLRPYYIISGEIDGTNHGQPYEYDMHVPLLLAGKNIVKGTFPEEVSPIDIAPTISSLLRIEFPPTREGRVLSEAIRYSAKAPYFSK